MFNALVKAFTGRAGFLASLLALTIIAVTAAAILLNLPRIELKLVDSSQSVLDEILSDNDTLVELRAEGRNLVLEGEFEDVSGLKAKLQALEGVRSVIINDSGYGSTGGPETEQFKIEETAEVTTLPAVDSSAQDTVVTPGDATAEAGAQASGEDQSATEQSETIGSALEEGLASEQEPESVSGEPLAAADPEPAPELSGGEAGAVEPVDQSSLSLRYDGTRLSLSGHLADEQMAQLIAEEISNAIPEHSELEINVDGNGKASPLNWMNEFLETVAGLPDDAQGLIEGSDRQGVLVTPDVEQTLRKQEQPPVQIAKLEDEVEIDNDAGPVIEGFTESTPQEPVSDAGVTGSESTLAETTNGLTEGSTDPGAETENAEAVAEPTSESAEDEAGITATSVHPGKYIVDLNKRIARQAMFEPGQFEISDSLAAELDGLAEMMYQNPHLLLRVVGNIDFSVEPRIAKYVGIDRAREIRDYLQSRRVEPFRVFATPLPRNYAFDKRVQIVFYISE